MNGYDIVQDLTVYNRWTRTHRYKTLKLKKNGKFYLYKKVQEGTDKQLIGNEKRWREFFDTVQVPGVSYTQIKDIGDDFIIFEWVDAPHLAEPKPESLEGFMKHTARYAELLAAMDEAAAGYRPSGEALPLAEDSQSTLSVDFVKERFAGLLKDKWLSEEDIELLSEEYQKAEPDLEKRYQHGDFLPWHIFVRGEEWLIYDAEHASSQQNRFRDLVHSYTRLAANGKRPDLAELVLADFLAASSAGQSELDKKTRALFIRRSMGCLFDAYNVKDSDAIKASRIQIDKVKNGIF